MSLEDKKKRFDELDNKRYLTEEEIIEKDNLKADLGIITESGNDYIENPENIITNLKAMEIKPKRKRTLYEVLREKFKEKPATYEEIHQLKLDAIRARLQADIAKSKAKKREYKKARIDSILSMVTAKSSETKKKKKSNNKQDDTDDLRELLGNNDSKKFNGLIR